MNTITKEQHRARDVWGMEGPMYHTHMYVAEGGGDTHATCSKTQTAVNYAGVCGITSSLYSSLYTVYSCQAATPPLLLVPTELIVYKMTCLKRLPIGRGQSSVLYFTCTVRSWLHEFPSLFGMRKSTTMHIPFSWHNHNIMWSTTEPCGLQYGHRIK